MIFILHKQLIICTQPHTRARACAHKQIHTHIYVYIERYNKYWFRQNYISDFNQSPMSGWWTKASGNRSSFLFMSDQFFPDPIKLLSLIGLVHIVRLLLKYLYDWWIYNWNIEIFSCSFHFKSDWCSSR